MECSFPRPIKNGSKTFYVPCGQCICCRINKTTEWSVRLLMEQRNWKNSAFVTLTYSDDFMPEDLSLHKEDLQKFFKRLRKRLGDRRIKYYACGEYGEKHLLRTGFGRPHYHIIIFGLDPFNYEDRTDISDSWQFCQRFLFDRKHKAIGSVNSDSIQYVTGYIRKKLLGFEKEKYDKVGIKPPFQLSSQGLGLSGFSDYYDEFGQPDYVEFNGHSVPIPRYFREKLDIDTSRVVNECNIAHIKKLEDLGFDSDELKASNLKFTNNGCRDIDFKYYETMRPYLEQNHANKIKMLSMSRRTGF